MQQIQGQNIFLSGRARMRKAFHSQKVRNCGSGIERVHRAVNRQITFHCRDVITDSGVALITGTTDGFTRA